MPESRATPSWWREAVVYQVYIRSFSDGDGDGNGDIAGLRGRLPYIARLGVDAIWINPWYPSDMADGGYDVADYRDIDARFGTLADADALIADAHATGLRVLLDIVPNHTSDQHRWFRAALEQGPGSPARDMYIFRDGRGVGGDEPPNDWRSVFGGVAWTRITEPDGTPGQWYLHLFAPEQPDLNWDNPTVREEFDQILRFWFDRGVDGFRIDVAHSLVKDTALPDLGADFDVLPAHGHPHWDREDVHDVYRRWRRVADGYDPPRVFVAEAWVPDVERMARYVRPDELHTTFNFDFLTAPWTAATVRSSIERSLAEQAAVGAPVVWVLSNHDVVRHVSRYGRDQELVSGIHLDDLVRSELVADGGARGTTLDVELGRRRARAAALLMLALPGTVYLYQGEELGLPEVEDLPDDRLQDPTWARSGQEVRGRDGCRVPLPWSGDAPPYGFGPDGSAPWLPQPDDWGPLTVAALEADPGSILHLYRDALRLRRELPALGGGDLVWLEADDDVLAFARAPGFACVVNFSASPARLPVGGALLLGSAPPAGEGVVPPHGAVWLRTRD